MPYNSGQKASPLTFVAVGVGCLIWCISVSVASLRYAVGSSWAKGQVTNCFARGVQGRNSGTVQVCEYEFQVSNKQYGGSCHDCGIQEGQKVDVAYLNSDPSTNDLQPPQWFPWGLVSLVACIGSFGVCGWMFKTNDDLKNDWD